MENHIPILNSDKMNAGSPKYDELISEKKNINMLYYLIPTLSKMESEYEEQYCNRNKDAGQNLYIIASIIEGLFNTNEKDKLNNFMYKNYEYEMSNKIENDKKQFSLNEIIQKTQVASDKLKSLYDDQQIDDNSKMMNAYLAQKNNKLEILKELLEDKKEKNLQALKVKLQEQIQLGILFSIFLLDIPIILYRSLSNQIQSFILSWFNDNHF